MYTRILTAIAAGALMLPALAQNYKVVITTTDGEKTEFETQSVRDIRFENAPNYAELDYLLDASYSSKNGLGVYSFTIASSQPDEWYLPPEVGDAELTLELVGAMSDDYLDAQIPAGYYRAGSGLAAGEFNVQHSGVTLRLAEGEDGTSLFPIVDGTVDVRRNGDSYSIKAEVILLQGGEVAFSYDGPIEFTPGVMETEDFSQDLEFAFTGAQARYFDGWYYPFASDITLEFYTGSFDANGSQLEGYWLNMFAFMPRFVRTPEGNISVADGVYTPEPRETIVNYTNLPYTFTKGSILDFWGTLYPTGTYLNKRESNGRTFRGYIVDGTMTVADNGTSFVFDFVTDNGKKISATYQGKVLIDDRSEPDKVPDISSTLPGDHTLSFDPGTVAASYSLGDYIKEGLYQFEVMVTTLEMDKGDFIMLELSADAKILPDGKYTIDNGLEPFTGIRGEIDYGGNILYSWYGDLDSADEDGYQQILAPIAGGSVTITTVGENKRKIEFNLVDNMGNSITGSYEGLFFDIDEYAAKKPAAIKAPTMQGFSMKEAASQAPRMQLLKR